MANERTLKFRQHRARRGAGAGWAAAVVTRGWAVDGALACRPNRSRPRTRWPRSPQAAFNALALMLGLSLVFVAAEGSAQEGRPMSVAQIVDMLRAGVRPARILELVGAGCVSDGNTPDSQRALRTAGATDGLRNLVARSTCQRVESPLPAPAPSAPASGRTLGPGGAEMVLIQPGTFQMGSGAGGPDERPSHRVTITRAFYLQTTEVTQHQWQLVMGANPSRFSACGLACPVERVSWEDVKLFIARLNQSNPGVTYRLPTEAEWEYAARAGTTGDYGGTGVLDQMGWTRTNAGGVTHAVAQKMPNAWGLYDMHGNVCEWVQDWYSGSYYAESPGQDPQGPATGSDRVLRGGSWYDIAFNARSAVRDSLSPSFRSVSNGFRLARTP